MLRVLAAVLMDSRSGRALQQLHKPTSACSLGCHVNPAACLLPARWQGDIFGSTFDLATAGAQDLPRDILVPGEAALQAPLIWCSGS